jgi:hypothetical protein
MLLRTWSFKEGFNSNEQQPLLLLLLLGLRLNQ